MNVHGSHHEPTLSDGSHYPSPGREMHHDRFPVPARPGCRTPAGVAGPGPTPSAARRTGCRCGRAPAVADGRLADRGQVDPGDRLPGGCADMGSERAVHSRHPEPVSVGIRFAVALLTAVEARTAPGQGVEVA